MSGNYLQNPLHNPYMSANDVHYIEPYLPPTANVPLDTYPPVEPVAAVNVCILAPLPLFICSLEAHGFQVGI
jgi:hypothetical protein